MTTTTTIKNKPHPCSIWTEQEVYLLRKLAPNLTTAEIAKRLNRNTESVKSKAVKSGISLRKYGEKHHAAKYSDDFVEQCRRMVDSGMSWRKTAKHVGVSYGVVASWLNFESRTNDRVILD